MRRNRWATIVLVALATACGGPDDTEAGGGQPADTTITTDTTATPAPATTNTTAPDTTGPSAPAVPVFDGISPASRADLLRLQADVDAGHQPWRLDPVATARAYLVDIGIPDPTMGDYRAISRRTGEVRFDAAVGGYAVLRQLGEGSLPYVVRVETAQVDGVVLERRVGEVRVEAYSRAPGTLVARVGPFESEWEAEVSVPVEVGPVTVVVAVAESEGEHAKVLQLRHEGADGKVGIAAFRLQPVAPPAGTRPRGDGLSSASEVTHTGIGPIMVGSSLDEVLAEAGVPMVLQSTAHCDGLRPASGLDGIDLIFPAERDVRFMVVTVSTGIVATDAGIRVGSTQADVLAAYPGIEVQGSGASGRLVDRSDDQDGRALVFQIRDSRVVGMQAGLGAEADELCA